MMMVRMVVMMVVMMMEMTTMITMTVMMVLTMMMVMHQTDVANYFAFLTNNVLSQSCICSVCPSNLICCETHKFVINHFISSLN